MPRSLFPIHLEGVTYQNDAVFDAALYTADLQPADTTVDGPSHFSIFSRCAVTTTRCHLTMPVRSLYSAIT